LRVATLFEAVPDTTKVGDLAVLFQKADREAVGVIDAEGKALGLVSREHLFRLLGKRFGVEVLSRKSVMEVLVQVSAFDHNANLFTVAERLGAELDRHEVQFYLLTDTQGAFRGIFTSKDLLTWLSRMTQEDIALAAQLQERLVPGRSSDSGEGWFVQAFSQSAKGLGGDFYHVIPLSRDKVFVTLGDVSGKGVAASVLTSLLWGVLKFYDFRKGLKKLLLQVNEALIHTFHLEKYLTGVFLTYDAQTRELTLADMGHGHSFLVREGRYRPLRFPNMNLPLGIDLGLSPTLYRIILRPGDLVCLYTDGLTEQVDATGEELGDLRLCKSVASFRGNPQALPEALLALLADHQGSVPRLDDVSWLQLLVD
jgi:sigma-B regulation protein RsbU (phosphoserine phosphatase)